MICRSHKTEVICVLWVIKMSEDAELQNKLRIEMVGAEDDVNIAVLLNRFVERSEREGALDIGYGEIDSPIGRLLVAATPAGVVKLSFTWSEEGVLKDLARRVSPRILRSPRLVDDARRQLDEYFEGRRHEFNLSLDRSLSTGFYRRVLDETARIPYGQTCSYQEMAAAAGNAKASRAGRQRPGLQSDPDHRSVSSCVAQRPQPRRVRRWPGGEAGVTRAGGGAR